MQEPRRAEVENVWCRRLEAAAAAALPKPQWESLRSASPESKRQFQETFADEFGHTRTTDAPLLARLLGIATPEEESRRREAPTLPHQPHAALWWRLTASRPHEMRLDEQGPLFPELRTESIESWTEAELSGLQALAWWMVASPHDQRLTERVQRHTEFLIAELQPDNATNRPWGIGVFAFMAQRDQRIEADHYAQTQLHNCTVTFAKPDRLSALILLDAAAWMRAMEAEKRA